MKRFHRARPTTDGEGVLVVEVEAEGHWVAVRDAVPVVDGGVLNVALLELDADEARWVCERVAEARNCLCSEEGMTTIGVSELGTFATLVEIKEAAMRELESFKEAAKMELELIRAEHERRIENLERRVRKLRKLVVKERSS